MKITIILSLLLSIQLTTFGQLEQKEPLRPGIQTIKNREFNGSGGPGADEMYFEYTYNRDGWIKVKYGKIEGERFKLATYTYREW
ncbi:MAG TPA: hypothetical protein VJ953_07620 [Saprospiraceae bacterium]|nr:hypothetical protein [Saprospiraceae bacterium]